MIYIIKCAYCGKTYVLDMDEDKKDFFCPSCAGANGLDNVQEKFKNKEELEASRKKTLEEIWGDEGSLDTIKSFQMAHFPVMGDDSYDGFGTESNYYTEEEEAKHKSDIIFYRIFLAGIVIAVGLCIAMFLRM